MAPQVDLFGAAEAKRPDACFVSGCSRHGTYGFQPAGGRGASAQLRRYCADHREDGEAYWRSLHQR